MTPPVSTTLALAALLVVSACQHPAAPATIQATRAPASGYSAVRATAPAETSYVFGWGDLPAAVAKPRGGSTRGASVTLAPDRPLPLPEMAAAKDAFARDRATILGLAGD